MSSASARAAVSNRSARLVASMASAQSATAIVSITSYDPMPVASAHIDDGLAVTAREP